MPRYNRSAFYWIVLALALAFSALASAAPDLEEQAKSIEGKLMTPCCMANTVAEHFSPAADRARTEIREMLAAGRTEQEILDHYVAQYGDQILAAPAPEGFNLVAYILPFLLLIAGCVVLLVFARKWARAAPEQSQLDQSTTIEPEYAERLSRELREFDSTV